MGKSSVFEETCGARIEGGRNLTSPFVRLTLYQEFLVVSCLDYRRSIRYEDIDKLDAAKTFLGTGLILAVRDGAAPSLTLWVRNVTRVKREISVAAEREGVVV
jgi:hypothetical protein